MGKLISFFILISASIGFAQNDEAYVNSMVTQKMAELEMQDNPEYFFRKEYCDGNIQIIILPNGKMCTSKSTYYTTYVFWKEEDDAIKIQKFDNCGSFQTLTATLGKTILRLLKDKAALKSGEVKPYEGEDMDDNVFGNSSVESCNKQYKFIFGKEVYEKNYKEIDLKNDSRIKNVHAKYNQTLQLIALDNELSKLLQNLEKSGRFIREN